jgi:hypothetical protein
VTFDPYDEMASWVEDARAKRQPVVQVPDDDAIDRMAQIAALSVAWGYETTPQGLAKRLWELGPEIGKLTRERDNLRTILAEYMGKSGEAIEVDGQPALRPTVIAYRANGGGPVFGCQFDGREGVRR